MLSGISHRTCSAGLAGSWVRPSLDVYRVLGLQAQALTLSQ